MSNIEMPARSLGANCTRSSSPMGSKRLPIGCVIMASGRAVRFGSNKLLADFDGAPLLCRAFAAADGVFAACVVVTRSHEVEMLCHAHRVPILLHDLPLRSDTVRLGLTHLLHEIPSLAGCVFLPGDQPLLTRETLTAMVQSFTQEQEIVRLCTPETAEPGSPVLFGRSYFAQLCALPAGKGGGVLLRQYPEHVRLFPALHPAETADADTPEALDALREILRTDPFYRETCAFFH